MASISVNVEVREPSQNLETPIQTYSEITHTSPQSSAAVRPLPLELPGGAEKKRTPLLDLLLPTAIMGFALERFAEAVDPAFHCQLCSQVLEEPACTPCGHVFCASCLLPWAARRRRCPLECQPLAPGELYRVLPLRSLVQQLRVQCDYRARGCGHTVRLRELAAHVQSCAFGPASRCSRHCPGGCGGGEEERHQETTTLPSGDKREGPSGSGDRPRVAPCRRLGKTLRTQLGLLQRRYQEKLARYMAHTRNLVRDTGGRRRVSKEGVGPPSVSGVGRGSYSLAVRIPSGGAILYPRAA